MLGELHLAHADDLLEIVEHDRPARGRALVDGKNVAAHFSPPDLRVRKYSSSRALSPPRILRPSLVRRQRMSSAVRAHSRSIRYSTSRWVRSAPNVSPRSL